MESSTSRECKAATTTLQIAQAENIARQWVKGRIKKREPGSLILVPVKCETYFSDNGGNRDRSEDLFEKIQKFYSKLLKAVQEELKRAKEKPDISIQYHPIDTIGCVAIKEAKWNTEGNSPVFQAEYLVRPPHELSPKGGDGLFISICRQIVSVENNKTRNLFENLLRMLTQEEKKLQEAIQKLKDKKLGERVKDLTNGEK